MSATNFASYANMTSLMTAIGEKLSAVNGAYVMRGSSTFANLPSTLTVAMTGYVYNMSEEFTTDSRFIEGTGKKYSAGTNVVVANTGTSESPNMKFDVMGSFVDVDALNAKIASLGGSLADVFDKANAYSIGDIVVYNSALYKFKAAHTAGADWSSSEVDPITVESLIASADPTSLTEAQINALIALLG